MENAVPCRTIRTAVLALVLAMLPAHAVAREGGATDVPPPPEVLEGEIVPESGGPVPGPFTPEIDAPEYQKTLRQGLDLILNREYAHARARFRHYREQGKNDPVDEIGFALVELIQRAENENFTASKEIDRLFDEAVEEAKAWKASEGVPEAYVSWLIGVAEGLKWYWNTKTGSAVGSIGTGMAAVDHLEKAAKADDAPPDALGSWGMYLYLRGRYGEKYLGFLVEDTRPRGRRLIRDCVDNAPVVGNLCRMMELVIAHWEKRHDDVFKLADALLEKFPNSGIAAGLKIDGLLMREEYGEALRLADTFVERDPGDATFLYYQGKIWWLGWKEERKAQTLLERAIELGLHDKEEAAGAHAVLGEIYAHQGKHDRAVREFRKAISLKSDQERATQGLRELGRAAGEPSHRKPTFGR